MITEAKTLAEIDQQALRLLYKELGVANTARFLKQFTLGYGDYTEERAALFADVSLDEIADDVKRRREKA
ncbi:hypothetical protein [Pyrinomonas methylaliphatogenes]|uniref:Uncharacterized protein n=1 Tax=Pyrinomonas methylaliphatogenes TaxID=454194 RepID=A0A0B6WVX6_9BACT|nr:hypothetical protein [Pyrinomonas methylaliphatogenes]CDM65246.1 hypothetical protein PYK22_01244 [Pyrinomonas methylaliphatogenes]